MPDERESSHVDHEESAALVGALGFAIITLSDTRTVETDKSGQYLHEAIRTAGHSVSHYEIVKDDRDQIHAALQSVLANPDVAIIVTSGGTGISMRDSAFETIVESLDKRLDGFGELFRMLSYEEIGAAAMLSRAVGGIACGRVVFSLPGSTKAVRLGMEKLILPQAAHLYAELHKHKPPPPG